MGVWGCPPKRGWPGRNLEENRLSLLQKPSAVNTAVNTVKLELKSPWPLLQRGMLTGLTMRRSYAGNQSCSDFRTATVLADQKAVVFLVHFIKMGLHHFPLHLPPSSPSPAPHPDSLFFFIVVISYVCAQIYKYNLLSLFCCSLCVYGFNANQE